MMKSSEQWDDGSEPTTPGERPLRGWLDVHAHYTTEHYVQACEASGHGQPDGMPGLPQWSSDAALELMAQTGTAAAVLSISSPGVHFGDASPAADAAARDLAAHVNDSGAAMVARRPYCW
ncbi:hypothetical protein [Amycolatopsis sacchari]|uniref:hypothetical protein n=1 Tax=Amycolatopsis sacchari TaxID=115433 RepID=UPI003D702632